MPKDVDAAWLTAAFRSQGWDVEIERAVAQLIDQSVGLLSAIIRYELTLARPAPLPGSVVLKMVTFDPNIREHGEGAQLWERETRFYRDIAPHVGVRVPRCYFVAAEPENNAYALVLEDLRGAEQPMAVSVPQAQTALRWLATLHSRWWGKAEATFPGLEREAAFERQLKQAVEANWPEYLAQAQAAGIPARQIAIVEHAVARFGEGLTGGLLAPTLIHYDFRIGNMMFADGELVVFDWQSPLVGQATTDLTWFLTDSLAPDRRRVHEVDLIEHYLADLVANGVPSGDLREFDRQMRLSRLRRLPMSVLLATTFANLAHTEDPEGLAWWAKDYDELERLWLLEGLGR